MIRPFAFAALLTFAAAPRADLRLPTWYDQNPVGTAPDWHYRVPINVPAGASVNSTIKVDVDFGALLTQLGVNGTFDANSPRVVRSSGALSTNQEFTDSVYAGASDTIGNSRGEVRFILEDSGAVTYYLYFDITANGLKPGNPQPPINGNFEVGGTGTQNPPGWTATTSGGGYDAQIRSSENPSITTDGNGATVTTDGTPFTGAQSYLLGSRTSNELANHNPGVTLTRSFIKPSSCPTGISLRYRPEGWDSSWANASSYDFIRITLGSGATNTVMVGPDGASYATFPYSTNFSSNGTSGNAASTTQSGYGPYNGFDTNNKGGHMLGMGISRGSQPWFNPTDSLAGFGAGSTITLTITTSDVTLYKAWYHIDDVEWCVVTPTLGTPEAFGVNIAAPIATTTYAAGQKLVIRSTVDATPTAAANPVTANVYDNAGALVASGIKLFNDGTHGDVTANDAIWSNDGSVGADPTYTFVSTTPSGANWRVRVFAKDASTSTVGATAGLVHIPGQPNSPEVQANFYNIDEQTFIVQTPALMHLKSVQVISDPVNGSTNPKSIPGAEERYSLRIINQGTGTVDSNSLSIVDSIPANTKLFVGDVGAPGSGPVAFVDGAPSSTLTWTFIALNSAADNVDFSNDGGVTWSYSPTLDADKCDATVTHIRLRPQGAMAGSSLVGNPYFDLQFKVRIK